MVEPAFVPPSLVVGEHVLRPFRSDDAAAWYACLIDPRVTEHTSWPPITPELIAEVVAEIIADYAESKSAHWGLGLMTAAVRAAVAWAFATGSVSRVEALVMTSNERSIALLERTGFRKERMLARHRLARGIPRGFYLYSTSR